MKVLKVRSSHKNSNSKKKQSQFSIIFILAFQYRSHSVLLSSVLIICGYKYLDAPGNRSETPGKFWNVVLEKDEDHLDRLCEKWRSVT